MAERKLSLGGGSLKLGGRSFSLTKKGPATQKADSKRSGRIGRPDDAPVTGEATNLERESVRELKDLKADFSRKKAKEDARFGLAMDTGFWVGVVFASGEDAAAFVEHVGVPRIGQYIDGYELVKLLGKPLRLEPPLLKAPVVNILQSYADLALDVGESPARPGTVFDD